jgi:lysophospholipase
MADIANNTLFPPVPSAETFINLGLNQRPTLFGCNATNFTLAGNQTVPPLIFYLPNAPYTANSNVSTFDLSYSDNERDAIIRNAFNGATQGNGTIDAEWPTCVACAVLSRSWWKAGEDAPRGCSQCFERYCWNGTTDDTLVRKYEPAYIIGNDSAETREKGRG